MSNHPLPPGFRFHPTDEELITHYLQNRASSNPCPVSIIAEVDIYKFDPWDLPEKAKFGEGEWYFFSPRDRKYPNGVRPNRAAGSGYWKATGTDKAIHGKKKEEKGKTGVIGVKKALVFYKGRPPKGQKTSWIMHEYRIAEVGNSHAYKPMKLRDHSMRLDDWVLCRIYKKSNSLSSSSTSSSPTIRPPLIIGKQHHIFQDNNTTAYLSTSIENNIVMPTLQAVPGTVQEPTSIPKIPTSFSVSEFFQQDFSGDYFPAGSVDYASFVGPQPTADDDSCFVPNQFDASQYNMLLNSQLGRLQ